MAVYEYRLTTYKRGARPRSKRLRELGSGSAAGSSSTIVNVSDNVDRARDLSEYTPAREQFLLCMADAVACGNITFEKAIETLDQAFFGASIDENDNAELKNIRKHSYFDCVEFVINRLCEIEARELEENLDKENNLTRHD